MSGSQKNKLCDEAKWFQVQMAYRDCSAPLFWRKTNEYFEEASSRSLTERSLEAVAYWSNEARDEDDEEEEEKPFKAETLTTVAVEKVIPPNKRLIYCSVSTKIVFSSHFLCRVGEGKYLTIIV